MRKKSIWLVLVIFIISFLGCGNLIDPPASPEEVREEVIKEKEEENERRINYGKEKNNVSGVVFVFDFAQDVVSVQNVRQDTVHIFCYFSYNSSIYENDTDILESKWIAYDERLVGNFPSNHKVEVAMPGLTRNGSAILFIQIGELVIGVYVDFEN